MKFAKTKLKRCKKCQYYKRIGDMHFCINNALYKNFGCEALRNYSINMFQEEEKMNYDITFCSNTKCKNLKCERNQNNITDEFKDRFIWQGEFKECEYWEEVENE